MACSIGTWQLIATIMLAIMLFKDYSLTMGCKRQRNTQEQFLNLVFISSRQERLTQFMEVFWPE